MRTARRVIRVGDSGNTPRSTAVVAQAAALVMCCFASAAPCEQTGSSGHNDTAADFRLQEVVVTASRRAENLRDTPAAVTAVTAADLERQGRDQFDGYMSLVPGLGSVGGAQEVTQPVIRGLDTGTLQNAPTVAVLVDDLPFQSNQPTGLGASLFPELELTDIERIEVLKGPQGTLYGASSLGGLIKIVSKRPDPTAVAADVRTGFTSIAGGGTGYSARGSLNLPLVQDELAARLIAFHRVDAGYTRNSELGTADVNKSFVSGASLQLRFTPAAGLDIELSGLMQNLRAGGSNLIDINPDTGLPLDCPVCYRSAFGPTYDNKFRSIGLVVNWSAPLGTLTNVLSYVNYSTPGTSDVTRSGLDDQVGIPVPPGTVLLNGGAPVAKKVTEEARFATARVGGLEGLIGALLTHETNDVRNFYTNVMPPPSLAPLPSPLDNLSTVNTSSTYDEQALFADATYYFAPVLDLTIGGRYSHERQRASQVSSGFLTPPGDEQFFHSNENPITYLATLRYRPLSQLSTYARFATGYRPGGPQLVAGQGIPTSYNHDTTRNYELGVKGRWLDGRMAADVAFYHIDWRDIQISTTIVGQTVVGNGGKATSDGVELALAYQPVRRLTTQLNVAYNRAINRNDVIGLDPTGTFDTVGARRGDRLPYAPRLSGSATADYEFPIGGQVRGNLGLTYAYEGSRHTNWSQAVLSPDIVLPSYSTLALRAGLEWGIYSIALRATNATNKYAYTASFAQNSYPGQGLPPGNTLLQPRLLVAEFAARF